MDCKLTTTQNPVVCYERAHQSNNGVQDVLNDPSFESQSLNSLPEDSENTRGNETLPLGCPESPTTKSVSRIPLIKLWFVLILTTGFAVVLLVASHLTHSLTLKVEAYHAIYNMMALGGCLFTIKISEGPATIKNTFGWVRIELLFCLCSLLFIASLCFSVALETIRTASHANHQEQDAMHHPLYIIGLGGIGLILNAVVFCLIGDDLMASKKPSGAEYKRRKKAKIEANQHSVRQLQNWLEKPSSSDISSSLKTTPGEPQEKTIEFGENTIIESQEKGREVEEEIEFGNSIEQEKDVFISITFNDPPSWPPITDKIRCVIIEHGPEQGEDANFKESASEDGRRFSKHWFSKKCSNGERVHRNWLLFSKISRSIFCFPCILFGKGGKSDSAICNQSQGFKDWKNLNRISDHENSAFHRDAYLHWKCFEKKLKTGGFIDDSLQKAIQSEKERWRNILRVVLDVILFCAQNNLPLRGTEEIIGNPNAGMFLKLIELISRYNMTIAEHVANHKKGSVSYLSNKIQDEFLLLLGKHVRNEILSRIKESKYFSLIFDCTPDLSHHEQMCQIIRYVIIRNDSITIEESFIDFIATKEKTGIGLACEIVNKLEKDGLDILNARGQGYDNGANMAGVYNGVQAIISQNNERAIYIPCAAHSLNLVCKNAVSSNANMITFFGIVQRIYTFFVNSTTRWDKLMSVLKTTLKGHTDTRWASRQNAIKELHQHIPQVYKILIDLKNEQPLQCAEIQNILKQINFKFLCTLSTWNLILQEVDNISKALQSKTMTIFKASRLIEGLSNSLQQMRDTIWENIFSKSENLALEMELSTDFEQKRRKFIILDDQSQQTVPYNCKYLFTVEMKEVIDILISQLRWRYEKLYGISSDFEFLSGEKLESMDTENLKKAACDLSRKYPNDLNSVEILSEISSFKNQAMTLIPDLKAATCLDILKTIHEYSLVQSYPNLEVALRIFLTLPVTVASGERSFSKLKIIKTYLRSSLAQEKLSNMAILSIEQEFANQINFDQIIDEFALVKARKVKL